MVDISTRRNRTSVGIVQSQITATQPPEKLRAGRRRRFDHFTGGGDHRERFNVVAAEGIAPSDRADVATKQVSHRADIRRRADHRHQAEGGGGSNDVTPVGAAADAGDVGVGIDDDVIDTAGVDEHAASDRVQAVGSPWTATSCHGHGHRRWPSQRLRWSGRQRRCPGCARCWCGRRRLRLRSRCRRGGRPGIREGGRPGTR